MTPTQSVKLISIKKFYEETLQALKKRMPDKSEAEIEALVLKKSNSSDPILMLQAAKEIVNQNSDEAEQIELKP